MPASMPRPSPSWSPISTGRFADRPVLCRGGARRAARRRCASCSRRRGARASRSSLGTEWPARRGRRRHRRRLPRHGRARRACRPARRARRAAACCARARSASGGRCGSCIRATPLRRAVGRWPLHARRHRDRERRCRARSRCARRWSCSAAPMRCIRRSPRPRSSRWAPACAPRSPTTCRRSWCAAAPSTSTASSATASCWPRRWPSRVADYLDDRRHRQPGVRVVRGGL